MSERHDLTVAGQQERGRSRWIDAWSDAMTGHPVRGDLPGSQSVLDDVRAFRGIRRAVAIVVLEPTQT